MKKLVIGILVFAVSGCGETTEETAEKNEPPKLEDYDRTCQFNSDCEGVDFSPCSCSCPVYVNKNDADAARAVSAKVDCSDVQDLGIQCEICDAVPRCLQGICLGRETFVIETDDFSTSCETADDCLLIEGGDVCKACHCPTVAVNAADYHLNVAEPECGSEDVSCGACEQPILTCVDNVCVATAR